LNLIEFDFIVSFVHQLSINVYDFIRISHLAHIFFIKKGHH